MANPDLSYLRAFFNAYNLVGIKTAQRIRDALTDAEQQAYSFERAAGDNLAFYNDLIEAWFGISSGSSVLPVPSTTIVIKFGTADTTATVPLGLAAGTLLTEPDLFKAEPPFGTKVPAADITLTLNAPDLDIKIINLAAKAKGRYVGLVTDSATADPVLEVHLLIV